MRCCWQAFACVIWSTCIFTDISASGHDSPVVFTQQGGVQGIALKSRNGNPYFSYRGIPYAKDPGRFKVARHHASWEGIRSAQEYGSSCAQINLLDSDPAPFSGEEFCHFINVDTPTLNANANLPVLFWIHGGGFMSWTGSTFEGKYFVDENVIVVTINYRLGVLGFMSFDDDEIEGNIGLKDQLLALKWVNKNIHAFGGDATKVTIAGFSAGASSAHFHMLSPLSKGLFRAAISHSGTALAFWALQEKPRELASKLAVVVGCPAPETDSSSTKETVNCLKSKPVQELVTAQAKLREWLSYPIVLFAPVIETESKHSFISESPEAILQNGNFNKVNWITGFTEDEGIMFTLPLMLNHTLAEALEKHWSTKAPIILGYGSLHTEAKENANKDIYDHYFQEFEIGDMTWQALTDMYTDRYCIEPCASAIQYQSRHSRIFPYVFRFAGHFSTVHAMYQVEGDHGVAHGDDLQYLFPGGSFGAPDYSKGESVEIVDFSKKFVKLWASFVHEMRPTATWGKQTIWKSYFHKKENAPIPFYEIGIDTNIWDENVASRIRVLKDTINPTPKTQQRTAKVEL